MRPTTNRQRSTPAALAAGAVAAGAMLLTGSAPAPGDIGDPAQAAGHPGSTPASRLQAGNAALGVHGVVPGPGGLWGLTSTTVTGQLSVLKALTAPGSPLQAAGRRFELGLMRGVDPGQGWGVSAASSAGRRPAVKNGWLPTPPTGLWVINSIGVVRHDGHRLLITVLSSGQPTEADGITQVQEAAQAAAAAITAGQGR